MKFKRWPRLAIAVFLAIAALMFHRSSLQPVLASSDDDVKTLTEIVMQESKVAGLNPASIALEQKRLADTVTFVGATGLVKHLEKDALLAAAGRESSDLKVSIATSAPASTSIRRHCDCYVSEGDKTVCVVGELACSFQFRRASVRLY